MIINTISKQTEPETNQPLQSSSQSYNLLNDRNTIHPSSKQLDMEGIRELILEMRI